MIVLMMEKNTSSHPDLFGKIIDAIKGKCSRKKLVKPDILSVTLIHSAARRTSCFDVHAKGPEEVC